MAMAENQEYEEEYPPLNEEAMDVVDEAGENVPVLEDKETRSVSSDPVMTYKEMEMRLKDLGVTLENLQEGFVDLAVRFAQIESSVTKLCDPEIIAMIQECEVILLEDNFTSSQSQNSGNGSSESENVENLDAKWEEMVTRFQEKFGLP